VARLTQRRAPRQERAQATVDAVVEAAALLIVEDGYARLSTNRIARRAGVSVGTLYQYFPHKEAIIEALVLRMADEQIVAFGQALRDVAAREPGVELGIAAIVDAVFLAVRVRPALARRLLLEAPRGDVAQVDHAWRQRCTELLRASMYARREVFRSGDVELMASTLVAAGFAILQDALAYRPELLDGDVLRDELTVLASRYLLP
jgi:AcrR family transcriptional regulator